MNKYVELQIAEAENLGSNGDALRVIAERRFGELASSYAFRADEPLARPAG